MVSETHTFTPTLVNEFRLAQVFTRNNQDVSGPRLFDEFGIKGALDTPRIKGLPQFTVTGFTSLGTAGPGTTPISASGSGNAPADKSGKVWQLVDSMSWVHSRHTFKFGGEIHRITEFVYATNSARPNFTFNGTYTGNALADFMLGYINTTGTSQQNCFTCTRRTTGRSPAASRSTSVSAMNWPRPGWKNSTASRTSCWMPAPALRN